jgi:uncharacterized protein
MIRKTLAALALLLAPAAHAQEAKDADPALWVVKDADTTIYLFGTVHVLKPGLSWFDEAVKTAFDASGEVVLEMVEPDEATMQGLIMGTGLNLTGPTLTEALPADHRAALAAASADIGIPVASLDRFKPWLAALTLSIAPLTKLGYDPKSGAESLITEAAKASNKQVTGLETAEQQLGFLNALPAEVQVKYLVSTLDHYAETGPMLDKMVADWAKGDPDALGKTMNEGMRETPEVGKALLTDRNARWADWIAARMAKPGIVFIAVGAGHLAGGDSVQAFLAKRKLEAVRVQY